MADRPIIFSAPMVQALLREAREPGTGKTQTRRIIKPRGRLSLFDGTWTDDYVMDPGNAEWRARSVPFAVGDRLWVKETWQTGSGFDGPQIAFRATGDGHDIEAWDGEEEGAGPSFNYERCPGAKWHTWLPDLLSGAEGIWRPSLFMPRWASRLTLLVTDVRVERLQNISEGDAIDEGALTVELPTQGAPTERGQPPLGQPPSQRFRHLWNSINGPEAWEANPWVAAVSFMVHARNIDQLAPIAEAAE